MNPCYTFHKLSLLTWEKLEISSQVKYQIKEETITDLILLELKRKLKNQIFVREFNKYEEGINGADWEFWITDHTGKWLCFRIQAKIINFSNLKYDHLHYQNSKKIFQSDLLSQSCNGKIKKIPIYCLYTFWPKNMQPDTSNLLHFNPREYGCSIITLKNVIHLRKTNTMDLKTLINYMFPWHILVCCETISNDSKIKKIYDIYSIFERETSSEEVYSPNIEFNTFAINEPPKYVSQIMNEDLEESYFTLDFDKALRYVSILKFD